MIGLLHKAQMCHVHGDVDLFEILSFVIRGVLLTKGARAEYVSNDYRWHALGGFTRARCRAPHNISHAFWSSMQRNREKWQILNYNRS